MTDIPLLTPAIDVLDSPGSTLQIQLDYISTKRLLDMAKGNTQEAAEIARDLLRLALFEHSRVK